MGACYYDFDRDIEVLYLTPFNYLISWVRNGYNHIRYRFYPLAWEKKLHEARQCGYKDAIEQTKWYQNHRENKYQFELTRARSEAFQQGIEATMTMLVLELERERNV